jgi:DNA-binding NarL/FixJ family response regulator
MSEIVLSVTEIGHDGEGGVHAALPRILLVDDDEVVRESLKELLQMSKFQVITAANVAEAIHYIDTESFDVLLSDLHMPGAGDGFAVISAMRHKNPDTIRFLFTAYPALQEAMDAILLQVDEILIKPIPIPNMVHLIRERLEKRAMRRPANTERVASILEREAPAIIAEWLFRVEQAPELTALGLRPEQRTGHLPELLRELNLRLHASHDLGTNRPSQGAALHGRVRQAQGYSIPMIIEESRILQVSIFHTLQTNLSVVNFSLLLIDVMTIADEVDLQLKQTIVSFTASAAGIAA